MYVTFLLEKRVFVLCNMENGGRKEGRKAKSIIWTKVINVGEIWLQT